MDPIACIFALGAPFSRQFFPVFVNRATLPFKFAFARVGLSRRAVDSRLSLLIYKASGVNGWRILAAGPKDFPRVLRGYGF